MATEPQALLEYGPVFEQTTVNIDGAKVDVGLRFGVTPHDPITGNTMYAELPVGGMVPFLGHRRLVRTVFETHNYLQDDDGVRSVAATGICSISIDETLVYTVVIVDPVNGLLQVRDIVKSLLSFGPMLHGWSRDHIEQDLIGRKVYYREQEAVVEKFDGANGVVTLRPEAQHFMPAPWLDEDKLDTEVTVDLLDQAIYWFRK